MVYIPSQIHYKCDGLHRGKAVWGNLISLLRDCLLMNWMSKLSAPGKRRRLRKVTALKWALLQNPDDYSSIAVPEQWRVRAVHSGKENHPHQNWNIIPLHASNRLQFPFWSALSLTASLNSISHQGWWQVSASLYWFQPREARSWQHAFSILTALVLLWEVA